MTKVSLPPEGSSLTARQVRFLKISVAIMTALLIVGILAFVYGMARQASKIGTGSTTRGAQQAPYVNSLEFEKGELKEVTASNGLIILHWQGEVNDLILTYDAVSGHELGRIQVRRR